MVLGFCIVVDRWTLRQMHKTTGWGVWRAGLIVCHGVMFWVTDRRVLSFFSCHWFTVCVVCIIGRSMRKIEIWLGFDFQNQTDMGTVTKMSCPWGWSVGTHLMYMNKCMVYAHLVFFRFFGVGWHSAIVSSEFFVYFLRTTVFYRPSPTNIVIALNV